uniref:Transmembrane protein n=1 Tax=Caenorhabditis tropicalis TaxID=1561998 RepID=A0A1I7TZ21_9PELO
MVSVTNKVDRQMRLEKEHIMVYSMLVLMLMEVVILLISFYRTFDPETFPMAYTVFYALWMWSMIPGFTYFGFCFGEYALLLVYRLGIRTIMFIGFSIIVLVSDFELLPMDAIAILLIEQAYLLYGWYTENLTYPGKWIYILVQWFSNLESVNNTTIDRDEDIDLFAESEISNVWTNQDVDSEFFDESDYVNNVSGFTSDSDSSINTNSNSLVDSASTKTDYLNYSVNSVSTSITGLDISTNSSPFPTNDS